MNQSQPPKPVSPNEPLSQTTVPAHPHDAEPISINSADLLHNHKEITIRHGDEVYRLRLTKSGKLILHK